MLQADKQLLLAGVKRNALGLRQRELEFNVERYTNLATQASVIAGFSFESLVELEVPEGTHWLLSSVYFVFGSSASDWAMNAHWNYQVENVYAYTQSILTGWAPFKNDTTPAANCYIYNATFYLFGDFGACTNTFAGSVLDDSVVHTNASDALRNCGSSVTKGVSLAPPAADAAITARAKAVLRRPSHTWV